MEGSHGEFEGQQRGRALRQVVDEKETLFEIIAASLSRILSTLLFASLLDLDSLYKFYI